MTGCPRSSGRRKSSTDTKNASMSTCRILRTSRSMAVGSAVRGAAGGGGRAVSDPNVPPPGDFPPPGQSPPAGQAPPPGQYPPPPAGGPAPYGYQQQGYGYGYAPAASYGGF